MGFPFAASSASGDGKTTNSRSGKPPRQEISGLPDGVRLGRCLSGVVSVWGGVRLGWCPSGVVSVWGQTDLLGLPRENRDIHAGAGELTVMCFPILEIP
jgi:hypothetical protein